MLKDTLCPVARWEKKLVVMLAADGRFMQESGYHDLKTNKLSREAMRAYLKERKDCTVIIVHAKLEELFDKALRDTHQLRYIIAFPMVCTEFLRSTSPFAPEEEMSPQTTVFKAEEYTDPQELQNLAELIGPYGIHYMGEKLMELVAAQLSTQAGDFQQTLQKTENIEDLISRTILVGVILTFRKLTLQALHHVLEYRIPFLLSTIKDFKVGVASVPANNLLDKSSHIADPMASAADIEDLISRTILVGVILTFRKLTLQALHHVLEYRIPFLLSTIKDFKVGVARAPANNLLDKSSHIADPMASAAGIPCAVDPLLYAAMKPHVANPNDLALWNWFLVFVGVTLPSLAMTPQSNFISVIEVAVNALAGAIFAYFGPEEQKQKMKDFLIFTSSRIMTLAKEVEKERDAPKAREATYILLDLTVEESPFLTRDQLESCFPYSLLRDSYNYVYRKQPCTFSNKMAMPCPPPMQADPMEYFAFSLFISCTRCAVMPDPEAASGWPKAMAPPLTLVLALSSPRSFSTARYWAEQNAQYC
eukprot:Em0366g4a